METKPTKPEILAHKLLAGQLSADEQLELSQWYAKDLDRIVEIPADFAGSESEHRERILAGVNRGIGYGARPVLRLWKKIAVAASVVLCLGLGYYFYAGKITPEDASVSSYADIAPGGNGATLTLADGRKILISDASAGNIANEAGVKISKTSSGKIIYEVTGEGGDGLAYNTLSTSRGQQYQVRLPDGSVVFLNAESSLRYPISFGKQRVRQVDLTGEGYFEVAKDKSRPFKVISSGQVVEVLGTHFNLNSYGDSGKIKTTLLEGSVQVSGGSALAKLVPGEQASFAGGKIWVEKADLEEAVAWKNGYFMFNEQRLEQIMQVVSRWYNVEVVFADPSLKELAFWGSVSRFAKVGELLRILESTDKVRFEVQGNKIIVSRF